MQMEVYDCRQKTDLIGATLLWDSKTNQKITSVAGKNVIKGGKASWDFYWQLFGRNSIDNKGLSSNNMCIMIREWIMPTGMAGEWFMVTATD